MILKKTLIKSQYEKSRSQFINEHCIDMGIVNFIWHFPPSQLSNSSSSKNAWILRQVGDHVIGSSVVSTSRSFNKASSNSSDTKPSTTSGS